MHLLLQPTSIFRNDNEGLTTLPSSSLLTALSITSGNLIPRSESSYENEDCTTSTTAFPSTTSAATPLVAGVSPSCTITKLSDAVIALGILCGFSIIRFVVLLICFIRQSNSSSNNGRGRGDRTPPCSHPSSPFDASYRDNLHDFDTRSRRRRAYAGLGIGENTIRDGRIHRRHFLHESPLARSPLGRSPLARSPLAPPRYVERAPEGLNGNLPQGQGMFPRSPRRNRMFARSPLAMAGYPFIRNSNLNPLAFAQAQGQAGLGDVPMQQNFGQHIPQAQPPMYPQQQQQYQDQAGLMQPEHVHHHHAAIPMPDIRGGQEQAQRGSVRPEEGNVGRSRDPSNVGTAVGDDLFSRMRREAVGSRRPSRSETEGSRGRRGGFDGGPPGLPGPAAL